MANDRELMLRKEIGNLGYTAPDHLEEMELEDYLNSAKEGVKQSDLNKQYAPKGKPKAKAEEPPPPPPPVVQGPTMEQIQAMLDKAAEQAVEKYKASQPAPVAPVAAPVAPTHTVVHVDAAKAEKPVVYDSKTVPEDDFMEEPFRVLHANYMHGEDHFQIGGRKVEPPYSKFLVWVPYYGPETNRYGSSHNIVTMCVHITHSRKTMEMFLADERWGGEFWVSDNEGDTDEVEMANILLRISESLAGTDYVTIKAMAKERGVTTTNLHSMRTKIALHDAAIEFQTRKKVKDTVAAQKKKLELLTLSEQ